MYYVVIEKTFPGSKHKYTIYVNNENKRRTLKIGDSRYQDFTMHKDSNRKQLYDNRHRSREKWDDPFTAGFWSKWLLWNKKTIKESIKDIENRFNIKIINLMQ